MKVIVIDDEPVHVRGIIKYVNWTKLGYDKVVGIFNSKEALTIMQDEKFDLVITDINMPEINGLELIHRINLLGKQPDIMIVSGYNEFTYAQEAIRLGVCAYILKPVKPEEIEENIRFLSEKKKGELLESDNKIEVDILNEIRRENNIVIGNDERKRIHPSIQKILLYIGKNYEKEITVQEIAEQFQINESYLSTLFKKEIGINLSIYLQRYRIYKAMELLKNSDLRINEIAYKVGYQNPCYFTEQFKKIFNITPSEIRKNPNVQY
jgi:two-component system response regulator YesN